MGWKCDLIIQDTRRSTGRWLYSGIQGIIIIAAHALCSEECFLDAGIPVKAINQIKVRRESANEITEAIIAHPAIRQIEFIGSAAIGRQIGRTAAKRLKPVLMN
jgi:acyl-CoA reductase-like NAD-dependent aldehyde dehydrogenase